MYLMYVDESGDVGLPLPPRPSPTTHFALSGLVIHESLWRDFINRMLAFRKQLKATYGLPIRMEIHASHYIRNTPIKGLSQPTRLAILRDFLDELASINYISITNVIIDKQTKAAGYDVFNAAWNALFQRFENTMLHGNFPGGHSDSFGLVLTDNTDGGKLTRMVRRMAVFNPVPHRQSTFGPGYRNLPIIRIIEDPHLKDSRTSHAIQACDTTAYFLHQKFHPNSFIRRSAAQNDFDRLLPVLNRVAATYHPQGIVVL